MKAVLVVTAIAGTLDIAAAHFQAWARTGRFPTTMLKGIAGGALGRQRAMQGDLGTMALGLFLHFFISFAFTLLFFLIYPRAPLLRKNGYAVGTAYALFTWAMMNYIVVPLSALHWPRPNYADIQLYVGWVIFTVVFGLPIAFGAAHFYQNQRLKG
jgi:hypothetical protein